MFANVILTIANFALILPITAGVFRFHNLSGHFKKFYYFLIFAVLFELLLLTLSKQAIRNDWLIHLYTPIEFFFICSILRSWNFNEKVKTVINYSVFGLMGLWVVYFIALSIISIYKGSFDYFTISLGKVDPVIFAVEAVFSIAFSILLLFNTFNLPRLAPLIESKKVWLSIAILIYFTGNILLYPSLNEVIQLPSPLAHNLWVINSTSRFFAYLFFSIAFLCRR